ncbi:hypothetical protein RUND412_000968 [Rhizina undulata]
MFRRSEVFVLYNTLGEGSSVNFFAKESLRLTTNLNLGLLDWRVHPIIPMPCVRESRWLQKKAEDQRRRAEGFGNGKAGDMDSAQLRIREAIAVEALGLLGSWKIGTQPGINKPVAGGASTSVNSLPAISSTWVPFPWVFSTSPLVEITAAGSTSAAGSVRPLSLPSSTSTSLTLIPTSLSISVAEDSIQTSNVRLEPRPTPNKNHVWLYNIPQEKGTNLATRCGEIARTKEHALNCRRYRVGVLRKDPGYKRAGNEKRRKMEEKFRGTEKGETFPDIGLLKRTMSRDFEDLATEHRKKRARKEPFLNLLEEEDESDTEDTIVVKFPGPGTKNGKGDMKCLRGGSRKNNAGMDNGKSNCQTTSKTKGKNTSKGKNLHKPPSTQPGIPMIAIPQKQIVDLTLYDNEVIATTSCLPANRKVESYSGNIKFFVEIPLKPQQNPGYSRERVKAFA